jgi:uncharacterized membrane protein
MSAPGRERIRLFGTGIPEARREAIRTTLWIVPLLLVFLAALLFGITYLIDRAAFRGDIVLPGWVNTGSADAGRQILTAIAAAVITVVGVVFSITILALQLASTQFGPRMLRNFIRDRGTQITLGIFVATFVYCLLTLGSIAPVGHRDFVPHLSITVTFGLALVNLLVLIYFIHHVATSIQLNEVVAGIARDLHGAIQVQFPNDSADPATEYGPSPAELQARLDLDGTVVTAPRSGYLQAVSRHGLVKMAASSEAVIQLLYRPGHFVTEGAPLARVWPADAGPRVARDLRRAHVTGSHRTLTQDLIFAVDQLVEIAIRALSPAVNDTFTALTCIDWLGDALCKISARVVPVGQYRDDHGYLRLIAPLPSYRRIVDGACSKIRQAGRGMPAVNIRQLDSLARAAAYTSDDGQRAALQRQADMILESSEEAVPDEDDRADVRERYANVVRTLRAMTASEAIADDPYPADDIRRRP